MTLLKMVITATIAKNAKVTEDGTGAKIMFNCINVDCKKELKQNQTFYCSRECRNLVRRATKKSRGQDKRMLSMGVTGRGVFDHKGNT